MNIATCLFALIVLAAVIFIHNLFLLRRIERLKHGQRTWKALSEANYQEAEELEGMLRRERTWRTLVNRRLNAALDARNWLITQIWGSPTIVRDLPDVYTIICELRDRLAASEQRKIGLASVIQTMNTEREALVAAAGRWQDQARDNAELVMTLVGSGWYIKHEVTPEDPALFVVYEIDGPRLGEGSSPEEAVKDAFSSVEDRRNERAAEESAQLAREL